MLAKIFWAHWIRISATYLLVLCEFILSALFPYLLGKALDYALTGQWHFFWIYVGLNVGSLFIGTGRRMWDTRVFLGVWARAASEATKQLMNRGVETSKIISRQSLITRYADFYENALPYFLCGIVDIAVSLTVLWCIVGPVALYFITVVCLSCISHYAWACLSQRQEFQQQRHREALIQAITHNPDEIENEYSNVAKKGVRKSDYEAASWGTMDVLCIVSEVILIFALVRIGASTGSILSTLIYLWKAVHMTATFSMFFVAVKEIQVTNHFLLNEE